MKRSTVLWLMVVAMALATGWVAKPPQSSSNKPVTGAKPTEKAPPAEVSVKDPAGNYTRFVVGRSGSPAGIDGSPSNGEWAVTLFEPSDGDKPPAYVTYYGTPVTAPRASP